MNAKSIVLVLGLIASASIFGGCKATVESAADDTKIFPMLPSKRIDPPRQGQNTIWVEFQDQTGQNIDLYDEIVDSVESRGYSLTNDFYEADYALWATLRMFDKKDENFNSRMAALGGVAGGVATGVAVAEATDNWWYGSAAGVAGGSVTGAAIGWATREAVWAMVVDVQLARKINDEGIETRREISTSSAAVSGTGMSTPGGIESGGEVTRDSVSQEVVETRTRLEVAQRLLGESKGTRMDRATAQQAIMPRMSNSLQQLLPRAR